MQEKNNKQNQQCRQVAEELWLNYYNNVLYERNIITEQERNRMSILINNRKSHGTSSRLRDAQ